VTIQPFPAIRFDDIRECNETLPLKLALVVLKLNPYQFFIVPDVGETITVKLIYDFVLHLPSSDCYEYSLENPHIWLDAWEFLSSWMVLTTVPITAAAQLLMDAGVSGQDAVGGQQYLARAEPYSIPSLFPAYMQLPDDYRESNDRQSASNY